MRKLFLTCSVILMVANTSLLSRQEWHERASSAERKNIPGFAYQTSVFKGDNMGINHLKLYLQIANSALQFVRTDSQYTASYEITLDFLDKQETSIGSRIIRKTVTATSFDETHNPGIIYYHMLHYRLTPGEYTMLLEVYDLETRNPIRRKDKITVPDFNRQTITASDILFLRSYEGAASDIDSLVPMLPAVRTGTDSLMCARIDLYAQQIPDSATVITHIVDTRDKLVMSDSITVKMDEPTHTIIYTLDQEVPFGEYELQLHITHNGVTEIKTGRYYVRWQNHPTFISNLEMAVESLVYVMPGRLYKTMMNANADTQKVILEQFWKERDPTPGTIANELEQEYYRRVRFSNDNFSTWNSSREGWKSDRGRIYCIYGPPSDVHKPMMQNEVRSPYEIWIYQDMQKRFIFQDRYQDGDYRLVSQEG